MSDFDLQPGPQQRAAESPATIICYGGSAGGGKTRFVVHQTAIGYAEASYGAVIFRRTFPELKGPGSVWEECEKIYPLLGGKPHESTLMWKFPSGATIQLSHLQHEKDVHRWQGKNLTAVAFEEATHFSEDQFWYLFSRLRNAQGLKTKFYLTCNPDPDSWLISPSTTPHAQRHRFVDWYIGDDGYPIQERSGVVRWFGRVDGQLRWFASEAEAVAGGIELPTSFTFISARLQDNPILMKGDPSYYAKLKALPPVEQAALLGGNWYVRRTAGSMFQEAWFPRPPRGQLQRRSHGYPGEADVVRRFITADLAGSPYLGDQVGLGCPVQVKPLDRGDPDWTRIGYWVQFKDRRLELGDMWSARDAPGAIEWFLVEIAKKRPRGTAVVLWQDPAQAGVHQIQSYTAALRGVARLVTTTPLPQAQGVALASRMAFKGRILIPKGVDWERAFFAELQAYPSGRKGHDDIASMVALAVAYTEDHPAAATTGALRAEPVLGVRNDLQATSRWRLHDW